MLQIVLKRVKFIQLFSEKKDHNQFYNLRSEMKTLKIGLFDLISEDTITFSLIID